ncbi:MAG: NTP transferase domain-containing protein, partial [Nitrospina sp.]|nr:NTP transferase domain-containing protein [Nitrospina sp.]
RSIVPDTQKVLAEVLKRPFLTFLLDQLETAGIRHVVLCTGYKGEAIHKQLGDKYESLRMIYSQEDAPLGTGGALRLALPHLNSDPVLVMNGDSYINTNVNAFLDWFSLKDVPAAMVVATVPNTNRYGRVILDEDSRVKSFEEKGGKADPGWINAGIYLFKNKLLENIPRGKPYSLEQNFFPFLVAQGFYGYPCKADFLDIGTPVSYADAGNFFQKIRPAG